MARKKGGGKQKQSGKHKTSSKLADDCKSVDSEIEDGQIVEEDEIIQELVEETDYGHSSCSSSNTTPERKQDDSSLVAALLPLESLEPVIDLNITGAEEKTTTGSKEKQAAEPTETAEAKSSTGSNEKQAGEPTDVSTEVEKAAAKSTDLSKEVDKSNGSSGSLGSKEEQPTKQTNGALVQSTTNHTDWKDRTKTTVIVGNLSTDTTKEELKQILGLRNTTFYGANVRIKLVSDPKHKYKLYALIEGPKYITDILLDANGMEYKKRKLEIEIQKPDKSVIPYSTGNAQRGGINEGSHQNSGSKRYKGDKGPIPNAPSRQEESVPCINGMEGEFAFENPETGGNETNIPNYTMANRLRNNENRQRLEEKKRRQLVMEVSNYHSGIPPPNAKMLYEILIDGLGLSNDPSKQDVQAIYQPDPLNPWKWAILLASEALIDKFQGHEITYDRNNLTYTFNTKKTAKPLMITIQSTPLITNDELRNALRVYGEIVKITKQGHKFANNIDSGLRKIFIMLNSDVQTRDIPGSIRTSDGIWRKLFFKGKLYFCGGCKTKHTYTEGCPVSHDEQREQNIETQHEQANNASTSIDISNTQQNTETPNCGRNCTEGAQTTQETTTTEKRQQQTTKHKGVVTDKGKDISSHSDTPAHTHEEDFPLSPSLVSSIPRPVPDTKVRELPSSNKTEQKPQTKSMGTTNSSKKDTKRGKPNIAFLRGVSRCNGII